MLPAAIAAILENAPLSDEKVAFAWRTAVGPAVAKVSTVELRNRVLYVAVRDARWQREVEHSAGIIRARLQSMLGEGAVKSITVTVP